MRRLIAAVVLAVVPTVGNAGDFVTGNNIERWCRESKAVAGAYILGAVDGIEVVAANKLFCLPDEAVSAQPIDIVCKWVADKPKDRHYGGSSMVIMGLSEAFPCDE